jgi:hypothetical protein
MVERIQRPNHDPDDVRTRQAKANAEATHHTDAVQRALENPTPDTLTPDVINRLQATQGNEFVNRLLQRSEQTRLQYPIQAKMTVTPANDSYEQEADQVADQIVQAMRGDAIQRQEMPEEEEELMMKRLQRQDDMEEEELMMKRLQRQDDMEEEELMMKRLQRAEVDEDGGEISSDLENRIESARGSGQPLDRNVAETMGQAVGADFSNVRVHTGQEADELNQQVQARAFTTGSDIFFRDGEYNPSSSDGQELLAHELTHTIQQGAVQTQKQDEND